MRGDPGNPNDWFRYAARDLERARRLQPAQDPEGALFHLQQAAEKALKGKLVEKGWKLQKTHDLAQLIEAACRYGLDFEWFRSDAELLTLEYIADRYPGSTEPIPCREEVERLEISVTKLLRQLDVSLKPPEPEAS